MAVEIQLEPLLGIKRKAVLRYMLYDLENRRVTVSWRVAAVEEDGTTELTSPLFNKQYIKELVADNSTMVDSATGDYVEAIDGVYPEGSITEWEFFSLVADYAPVIVNQMLAANGAKAAAAGRFDFV